MTNKALLYRPAAKWPIVAAFTAAAMIHLSALAIASHRQPPAASPEGEFTTVEFDPTIEPPKPQDLDVPLPSSPAMPPISDFVEAQPSPHAITRRAPVAPIRVLALAQHGAVANPKAFALNAPRPEYPYEARSRHITGSGIVVMSVDPATGQVADVKMERSIGNSLLDNSTLSAFRRWRFKPGTPPNVRVPITFLMTGAQY